MRGKPVCADMLVSSFGITPAYAGKTNIAFFKKISIEDHPRVCGENYPI